MLFFAVPRLERSLFAGDSKKVSRWILVNAGSLRDKAVQTQKRYILNVDMDSDRFWISDEAMVEEDLPGAREGGFELPDGQKIIDVIYPGEKRISSGTAGIVFYPKGYSDRAIIHVQDNAGNRRSYCIEPFLPKVKIRDSYVEFKS